MSGSRPSLPRPDTRLQRCGARVRDGAEDDRVFGVCRAEGRVLVTLDLDFANPIRYPPGLTEGVVVLRPLRPVLPLIERLLRELLPALNSQALQGTLWIAEPGRVRIYDPNQADRE